MYFFVALSVTSGPSVQDYSGHGEGLFGFALATGVRRNRGFAGAFGSLRLCVWGASRRVSDSKEFVKVSFSEGDGLDMVRFVDIIVSRHYC